MCIRDSRRGARELIKSVKLLPFHRVVGHPDAPSKPVTDAIKSPHHCPLRASKKRSQKFPRARNDREVASFWPLQGGPWIVAFEAILRAPLALQWEPRGDLQRPLVELVAEQGVPSPGWKGGSKTTTPIEVAFLNALKTQVLGDKSPETL